MDMNRTQVADGKESQDELKQYQLVLFKKSENDSVNEDAESPDPLEQNNIDIVPGFWPYFNAKLGKLVTPFLPAPMSHSDIKVLHKLVRNRSEPLSIWPDYPIELVGHAKNYKEALSKIRKLETQNYVYSTDDGKAPEEKSAEAKQVYREKKRKENPEKMDELLSSAPKLLKNVNKKITVKENSPAGCSKWGKQLKRKKSDISSDFKKKLDLRKTKNSFDRSDGSYSSNIDSSNKNSSLSELEFYEYEAKSRKTLGKFRLSGDSSQSKEHSSPINAALIQTSTSQSPESENRTSPVVRRSPRTLPSREREVSKPPEKSIKRPGEFRHSGNSSQSNDQSPPIKLARMETSNPQSPGSKDEKRVSRHLDESTQSNNQSPSRKVGLIQTSTPKSRRYNTEDEKSPFIRKSPRKSSTRLDISFIEADTITKGKPRISEEIQIRSKLEGSGLKKGVIENETHVFNPVVTKLETENPILLFQRVLKAIYILSLEQKEVRKQFTRLSALLESSSLPANDAKIINEDFAYDYGLNIPFTELKEFQDFDQLIDQDCTARKKLKQMLCCFIDKDDILTRTMKNMIQQFISRKVIMQYTARRKRDKYIFKDTRFCKTMKAVLNAK